VKFAANTLRDDTRKMMGRIFEMEPHETDALLSRMFEMTQGAIRSTALVYSAIDGAAFTIAHALATNSFHIIKHAYVYNFS